MTVWYEAELHAREALTHNVSRFLLNLSPETPFPAFDAGQFITMDLPVHEKRAGRWRSYSIAAACTPVSAHQIELCIVKKQGGLGSEYLFNAEIGTKIKFKGPDGAFCLPKSIEKDLVFVCTGTGIAPFRAMLQQIEQQNIPHKRLHLIFGTRTYDEILYESEWENLAAQNPNFQFDAALSRAARDGFFEGYVHQIYQQTYQKVRPDVQFYLCGWSNMIDDAVAHLLKMGYDRSQIRYELYG